MPHSHSPSPIPFYQSNAMSPTTTKRLRSCLSPTRTRCSSPALYPNTGSGKFEAAGGRGVGEQGGKRIKTVRWQELNGCAVASFHDTYSHEEYDRTPLEPPAPEERECVLPERGSRCLSAIFSNPTSFYSAPTMYDDDEEEEEDDDLRACSSDLDSFMLQTPPSTEVNSEDGDPSDRDEEGEEEQDGWDSCMQRRRMMFSRLCGRGGAEGERYPEFEGYKSLSATLVQLLQSVGCDDGDATEAARGENEEEEDDEEEEEEEERGRDKGLNIFGLSSLPPRQEEAIETGTPSLVSTEEAESEIEWSIRSPDGGSCGRGFPVTLGRPIRGESLDFVSGVEGGDADKVQMASAYEGERWRGGERLDI
ncbi:hypothetical protein L198_06564 [Cryptococcus wingfieldii CBS 7118]|uniref:Uncharacterized protein n=1 Tax=Cryptococcus wingfieldii CBS 7118 TaxID=1295528 RepID=A0A1E3IJJ1_9TREE|nr:hypothetical protein L198_06564 [Cryptococcus wingfieldii CBS 7118]ODN88762.1 hypothetical protein L198_06564 [Cryptococcus wingfieldii CBS 7118]